MKNINAMIAGARGSGKTFFVLATIAQLATLPNFERNRLIGNSSLPTQIFCIDFKNSDLARLASILPNGRVAINKREAINVVQKFDNLMHQRLEFIKQQNFGSTASNLGMPLYYLIIDEWSATNAAFNQGMGKDDKILRYKWSALINEIAMMGRLPGFGLIIISQQMSVVNSGVSSAIQEEAGLKVHFGDANMSAYRLTFGDEVQIPEMHLDTGEAFAWIEGVATSGYVIPFAAPYIDTRNMWDVLIKALSNQDDEKYLFLTSR